MALGRPRRVVPSEVFEFMEVTYELIPEDVWRFALFYRSYRSGLRPAFLNVFRALMLLIFIGGLFVLADSWERHEGVQWSVLIGVVLIVWVMRQHFGPSKARVLKNAVSRSGLICRHSMALGPKWLSEKTEVNETKARWDTIEQVVEDAQYIYIFVSKTNAYIVPKRAFHYPAEAQAFVDTAKNFWMNAKTGVVARAQVEEASVWPPPPSMGG